MVTNSDIRPVDAQSYLIRRSTSGSFGSEEDDRMSSASDCSYSSFLLADVEDVNAVARLQEESKFVCFFLHT